MSPKGPLDHELIRELAKLLDETRLTEIEIEQNGLRVRIARQAATVVASAPPVAHVPPPPVAAPAPAVLDGAVDPLRHPGVVTSPMVGTAYLSPEPNAAAFVKVGDRVAKGQTILIIEAMKVMNPIPAPHAGTVTQILVQDGQPVEFAEPLMVVA